MDQLSASTSPPDVLQRLPPEILLDIIRYAIIPSDPASCRAILLTSRYLYQVALRDSVKELHIRPPKDRDEEPEVQATQFQKRISGFLRYIIYDKRDLASRVETIDLSLPNCQFVKPARQDLSCYKKFIRHHASSDRFRLYNSLITAPYLARGFRSGCGDAYVAMLLIWCPNIRNVFVELPHNIPQPHTHRILEQVARWHVTPRMNYEHPLSRLQRFTSVTPGSSEHYPSDHRADRISASLFQIPTLVSFHGTNIIAGNLMGDEFSNLPPRSSSVQDISLRNSYITCHMLHNLLDSCNAVKKLEITTGSLPEVILDSRVVWPREVTNAILPHVESLEYLHVNLLRHPVLNAIHRRSEMVVFGRELRSMRRLKTLVVDMISIIGFAYEEVTDSAVSHRMLMPDGALRLGECLPENLEHLEIEHCVPAFHGWVQDILSAICIRGEYRELKHIRLCYNMHPAVENRSLDFVYDASLLKLEIVFPSEELRDRNHSWAF